MRTARLGKLKVRLAGGSDREGGGSGPLVVLMHGYGAPGDDLVPLCRVIDVPQDVRFAFPEAPLMPPEVAAYGGRAWWPIDIEAMQRALAQGSARDRSLQTPPGLAAARALVLAALDDFERDLGVPSERIVLGGFSQGAMLACDVALRSDRPLAGLVLLSATLLCADEWLPLMAARRGLPVLQTHGTQDPLLPYALAVSLRDHLLQAGVAVEWHEFRGGHELPDSALQALGDFIRKHTG